MNIKTNLLLTLILITAILIPGAMATGDFVTITFSDLDFDKNAELLIYDSTGELISQNTTSDTIELNSSLSYMVVFKPSEQVWFQNPLNGLELLKIQMPILLTYLLFVLVIAGGFIVVFGRKRK
jgi:hypothetical protein